MNTLTLAILKGIAFGMTIAAIPGPIFFLIVQRTLLEGVLIGLSSGLGALAADVLYAGIAGIGVSLVFDVLLAYHGLCAILGGIFLGYLGVATFRRHISMQTTRASGRGICSAWLSTFFLTLANPVTIISYCVIFAGLGIDATDQSAIAMGMFIGGVIAGASLVMISLVGLLGLVRGKLSLAALKTTNRIAGILLIIFGLLAIFKGFTAIGIAQQVC